MKICIIFQASVLPQESHILYTGLNSVIYQYFNLILSENHFVNMTLTLFARGGGQNCPTFSKSIIATNRHTAVKCGFVTFNEV